MPRPKMYKIILIKNEVVFYGIFFMFYLSQKKKISHELQEELLSNFTHLIRQSRSFFVSG